MCRGDKLSTREREREGRGEGGFWKSFFWLLGASEVPLVWSYFPDMSLSALQSCSEEVKPVQKLLPRCRLMRYILSGPCDRVAPFCLPLLNHTQSEAISKPPRGSLPVMVSVTVLWAAPSHPISLCLTVNNTIICFESQASPVRLAWMLVCRWSCSTHLILRDRFMFTQ